MAGESQVGESSHIATDSSFTLIEKVLERMEELESYWIMKMNLVMKDQEENSKVREQFDELWTQHKYTDLMCTQLEVKVKEIEEARDRGLEKILNLQKSLDEARDEIVVLKRAVRHD